MKKIVAVWLCVILVFGSTLFFFEVSEDAEAFVSSVTTADNANILLVDADSYGEYLINYYFGPIQNNSAIVTVWDVYGHSGPAQGKPTASDMAPYNIIIWVPDRGYMWDGCRLDSTDEAQLAVYLNNGGNLMFSNIYYTDNTDGSSYDYDPGDFAYDYLGLDLVNGFSGNEASVDGVAGDPVFDGFGPHALDWSYWFGVGYFGWESDDLTPTSTGATCIYNDGPLPASVRYDSGTFKTIFMGFPFDTLDAAAREDAMARILDWFMLSIGPVHNINTDEYFNWIQTAIDDPDTLNGHTIEVSAGMYSENVVVSKRLDLVGAGWETTIIDGCGAGVVVRLDTYSINISGFTIRNGATGINEGVSSGHHIFNNNITDNTGDGIYFQSAGGNTINNNIFYNNGNRGFMLYQASDGTIIHDNLFKDNTYGLYSEDTGSGVIPIYNNTFTGNQWGIYITSTSDDNLIFHNNLINNTNQAYDEGTNNWDNGYPSGGNYWGDYNGVDFFSGPNQTIPGSDGIGDTPYINIDGGALPNYTHRIPIEINNSGNPNTLTNYQILLTIDTLTLISEGNMQPDGDDIRFTDEDEITPISFWIENGIATSNTTIWVKVPNITAYSTKEIFMYFGNSSATGVSSGDNTFLLFDNFEGSTLNTTKWTATSWATGGSVTVNGGFIEIRANSVAGNSGSCRIVSNNIIDGYAMRVKAREVQFGGDAYWEFGGIATSWVSDQGVSLGSAIKRGGTNKGLYTKPTGSGIWSTFTMDETTDSIYEIKINDTHSYAYDKDGNLLGSTVNGESFSNLRAGAWAYAYGFDGDQNPTRISLDWISVRNFASIEPIVQVGNIEEIDSWQPRDDYPLMTPLNIEPLFSIPLSEGWNLISLPFIQMNESVDSVLQSIDGKWDCIQVYDALDTAHWKTYATFKPEQLNDQISLNNQMGFWINITESNVILSVHGEVPNLTNIPLYAGWNLVGYPTLCDTMIIPDALWGTSADKIIICDTNEPYNLREPSPTYMMKPGEGYWVHVPADTVWVVDW